MRDRKLTGPWAGFSFKAGRLVTPEGRELLPEDLAWLSLTASQAQEWRRMMENRRAPGKARKPMAFTTANVIDLATTIDRPRPSPVRGIRLDALKGPLSANNDA
ncbi:TPA: DUF3653 domain-containing protein [Stenotrophomonas maltophilia]|uniref:DUF3653 domain-containing protein n=1 Tax=Stenotrophomonas maltophilia TaxID=40324 RepID=UPI0013107920|nr:DUF3653 domain-containing protein [Stenotrophomonas maltophilia]EKX6272080.1 hypothetical protein [Stenotrophomonas maltophilia]